jgi:hypothetical protein
LNNRGEVGLVNFWVRKVVGQGLSSTCHAVLCCAELCSVQCHRQWHALHIMWAVPIHGSDHSYQLCMAECAVLFCAMV